MLEFKRITPKDKDVFDSFYQYKTIKNCETAFANLCAWSFIFNGEYTIIDNSIHLYNFKGCKNEAVGF